MSTPQHLTPMESRYLAAAQGGDLSSVKRALLGGAHPGAKDIYGRNAVLEVAAGFSFSLPKGVTRGQRDQQLTDVMAYLLENHPDAFDLADAGELYPRNTALHEAVAAFQLRAIQCLLAAGAPTESRNERGLTPLALALSQDPRSGRISRETVALLHGGGARWDAMTQQGLSALDAYRAWDAEAAAPFAKAWLEKTVGEEAKPGQAGPRF